MVRLQGPPTSGVENTSGARSKKLEDSALFKHDSIHHAGEPGLYNMKVLRTHRRPLSRQIQEATIIENSTADIVMNSKGEWNGQRVPRITVELGAKTLTEDYRGAGGPMTRWQETSNLKTLTLRQDLTQSKPRRR